MKTGLIYKLPSVLAVATLSFAASASAQPYIYPDTSLLYQDVSGPSTLFSTGSAEIGDQIVVIPNSSALEFDVNYYLNVPGGGSPTYTGNEAAEVRFYENNGPVVDGSPSPGTVIYDSGVFSMVGFATQSSISSLAFDLPGLIYPNTGGMNLSQPLKEFTWTIQFDNLVAGEDAGLTLNDPATVGANYPNYWQNTGTGWSIQTGEAGSDFGADVWGVIPEPSTMGMVGGLGLLIMMVRRRLA